MKMSKSKETLPSIRENNYDSRAAQLDSKIIIDKGERDILN